MEGWIKGWMHNWIEKEFVYISINWLFKVALSNAIAPSPLWLLKFNLTKMNKIKNSIPQSHQPHFRCLLAWPHVTSGHCARQHRYTTFLSLQKFPLDSTGLKHQSATSHFQQNKHLYFFSDYKNNIHLYIKISALVGVAQWIEHWLAKQRVTSLIPSEGPCLGCRPNPQ